MAAEVHIPNGKSDSGFYANINSIACTGVKFAWGLDGKIAEVQRRFLLNSSITLLWATANVGKNTSNIKGQSYSDSIDWTLPIGARITLLSRARNPDPLDNDKTIWNLQSTQAYMNLLQNEMARQLEECRSQEHTFLDALDGQDDETVRQILRRAFPPE